MTVLKQSNLDDGGENLLCSTSFLVICLKRYIIQRSFFRMCMMIGSGMVVIVLNFFLDDCIVK